MKTSLHSRTGFLAALVAFVGLALLGVGSAATVTVTNNQDNAPGGSLIPGSLRWALSTPNTLAGDTVVFSSSLKGKTIVLKAGQLVVDKTLTINGLGCNSLTVSGNNVSRVFYLKTSGSTPTIISDMTITKGNGVGSVVDGGVPARQTFGGGIHSTANVQLVRCCVTNNKAPGSGGGIYNRGTLSAVRECSVSYNTAGQSGGGFFDDQDTTIERSAFYNNIAGSDGGGLQIASTTKLINSTVAANRAGGSGGGISDGGGTFYSWNSTIAGNTAVVRGGGIAMSAPFASWQFRNTIVATNSAGADADVSTNAPGFPFPGTFSKGNNLIGSTNGGTLLPSLDPSDLRGIDPKLGPLQDNGGPTLTMALLPGSPAIDAGNNAHRSLLPPLSPGDLDPSIQAFLLVDQRGFIARTINGGTSAAVDIGAYEYATARSLKHEAIAELSECLSHCTDSKTRANIYSAIRNIQCSLANRLWLSDTKLSCSGELVFEFEEDAAYAIKKIIKYSPDLACVAAATNAVQDLLLADEQLARAAISEALACRGKASYIEKANKELDAAQASAAKQDYKGAIGHYSHAWEYAQKACNRERDDGQCRRDRDDCEKEDRDRWGDDDRCGGDRDDRDDD